MVSIADKLREKIDIIKTTSGTGTTAETLKQSGPVFIPRVNQVQSKSYTSTDKPIDVFGSSPMGLAYEGITNFWDILLGTGEQKAEAIGETYGIFDERFTEQMDIFSQKAGENIPDWGTQQYFTTGFNTPAPITMPEFPDIFGGLKDVGKWILIGGGVLAGVYLLGKILGRKK